MAVCQWIGTPRATLGQMIQCLDVLVQLDAAHRLHRAKAMRQSEADVMSRQIRDTRDLLLAIQPHKQKLIDVLGGVQ